MRYFLMLAIMLLMISSVQAYTGFGICNYGKETIASVICYGPAVLKGTTVAGNVKVAGPLRASQVKMNSMAIAGSVHIQDSTIGAGVEVTGSLTASGVNFEKDITATTDSVSLNKSIVKGSITIISQRNKPYLKLQCGSGVAGNVTFSGVAGVVQVTDDSGVQGKILNGNLEFVKTNCQ